MTRLRTTAVVVLFLAVQSLFAQSSVRGTVTDAETGQLMPSVNISIVGTKLGAVTDVNGAFEVPNVGNGRYQVKASILGYAPVTRSLTVADGDAVIDFTLKPSSVQVGEVVVEVNRARERETPVAFSNIGSADINKKINSQDAPLLLKGTPGVFSYSTDGVGNGEARLFVRGFDQNRVQVMINGVPTNDPESNAVYWSNWGAVSSAAATIQVQRGAGSSLYGSGSFGGSFNIVTQEVPSQFGGELHGTFGDPSLMVLGGTIQSGLLGNNLAALSLRTEYKSGLGNRAGSYYEGVNYYLTVATYPAEHTSAKIVLHGGPQEHTYSNNAPVAYFKRFGYDANPANYLPLDVLTQMVGSKTLEDSLRLSGDSRMIRNADYLGLAHNFYHKPQLELHLNHDIDELNSVRGTFFYSVGRGGGSAVNSTSSLANAVFGADTAGLFNGTSAYQNLDEGTGVIKTDAAAAKYVASRFLSGAYQRVSYSFHRQWGIIGSWDTRLMDELKVTVGGEYRDWFADHPGHFTNLFGKKFITGQSYGYRAGGVVRSSTFSRRGYQGDLEFGGSDRVDVSYFNPFMDYTLNDDGGTYNSQYRNYVGETKQGTLFLQANYKVLPELTLLGSLQYVFYNYHIYENMPSESAIADSVAAPSTNREGLAPDGYFYMSSFANAAAVTPNAWYRFKLVDVERSRGFLQPKLGVNYNLNENINLFANFSHVERLVDLSVFYNSGNPNPDADDEISNQYEAGIGYKGEMLKAQANLYMMTWENKTATIQDISKAGQAGYDRNGFRYELVGSSQNRGVELEASYRLDEVLGFDGLTVNASFTAMDNTWTEVLDAVKVDPNKGTLQEDTNLNGKLDAGEDQNANGTLNENRRLFDNAALDSKGAVDMLYFVELENTVNASTPFTTLSLGVTYENEDWFAGINSLTTMNHYALDGGTYVAVDGSFDNSAPLKKFVAEFDNKLPAATVFDAQVGFFYNMDPVKFRVAAQVYNILNEEFLVSANRSGVLPGISRSFRVTVAVGF